MSRNLKITLGLVAAALFAALAAITMGGDSDDGDAAAPASSRIDRVVRPDSQRLSVGSEDVVFVEFLDFECEACGAAYPAIEQLRETYGDRVTFMVRNFPLHNNSVAAAKAAEAAAEQGKFEEMYSVLFETQARWGEKTEPQEEVFFGYAEEMGLEMDRFREVYNDPAIDAKIERDAADGRALGVQSTPTFFINDEMIKVSSFDDLVAQLDAALAE